MEPRRRLTVLGCALERVVESAFGELRLVKIRDAAAG